MAEHRWSLLCRNVIPEPEIGGNTLNGVFDEFVADKYPADFVDPRFVGTQWVGEIGEEFDQTVVFGPVDGSSPPNVSGPTRVRFTLRGNMVIKGIQGISIEKAGPHKFTIRADGRDVYSFTVLAKLRDS